MTKKKATAKKAVKEFGFPIRVHNMTREQVQDFAVKHRGNEPKVKRIQVMFLEKGLCPPDPHNSWDVFFYLGSKKDMEEAQKKLSP